MRLLPFFPLLGLLAIGGHASSNGAHESNLTYFGAPRLSIEGVLPVFDIAESYIRSQTDGSAKAIGLHAEGGCSAGNPCILGSCCNSDGQCGYRPEHCSPSSLKTCVANCDAKAPCGEFSANGKTSCPLNACCSRLGFCGTSDVFCRDAAATTAGGSSCPGGSCGAVDAPSCGKYSGSASRRVAYYQSWNIRRRPCDKVWPSQLDTTGITHLVLAFATFDPKTFQVGLMNRDDEDIYKQFMALPDNIEKWLGIGGFEFTDPGPTRTAWSDMTSTQQNRKAFIDSLQQFCSKWKFRGIDIDWEWPSHESRGGNPKDGANQVELFKEMRQAFGDNFGLGVVIPAQYEYLKNMDVKGLETQANWLTVLVYDLHGPWDANIPGLGPKIKPHTDLKEIDDAMKLLWSSNIDSKKVNMGISNYGRGYTVADKNCMYYGCTFTSPSKAGSCTLQEGVLSICEIRRLIDEKNARVGVIAGGAEAKEASWDDQWVSFDDSDTIAKKQELANDRCLGGTALWAIDYGVCPSGGDSPSPKPGNSGVPSQSNSAPASSSPSSVAPSGSPQPSSQDSVQSSSALPAAPSGSSQPSSQAPVSSSGAPQATSSVSPPDESSQTTQPESSSAPGVSQGSSAAPSPVAPSSAGQSWAPSSASSSPAPSWSPSSAPSSVAQSWASSNAPSSPEQSWTPSSAPSSDGQSWAPSTAQGSSQASISGSPASTGWPIVPVPSGSSEASSPAGSSGQASSTGQSGSSQAGSSEGLSTTDTSAQASSSGQGTTTPLFSQGSSAPLSSVPFGTSTFASTSVDFGTSSFASSSGNQPTSAPGWSATFAPSDDSSVVTSATSSMAIVPLPSGGSSVVTSASTDLIIIPLPSGGSSTSTSATTNVIVIPLPSGGSSVTSNPWSRPIGDPVSSSQSNQPPGSSGGATSTAQSAQPVSSSGGATSDTPATTTTTNTPSTSSPPARFCPQECWEFDWCRIFCGKDFDIWPLPHECWYLDWCRLWWGFPAIQKDDKDKEPKCKLLGCGCGFMGLPWGPGGSCKSGDFNLPFPINIVVDIIGLFPLPCIWFGCNGLCGFIGCDGWCFGKEGCVECPKLLCPHGGPKPGPPPSPFPSISPPGPTGSNGKPKPCEPKDYKTATERMVYCGEFVSLSSAISATTLSFSSLASTTATTSTSSSSTCHTVYEATFVGCYVENDFETTTTSLTQSNSLSSETPGPACTRAPLSLDDDEGNNIPEDWDSSSSIFASNTTVLSSATSTSSSASATPTADCGKCWQYFDKTCIPQRCKPDDPELCAFQCLSDMCWAPNSPEQCWGGHQCAHEACPTTVSQAPQKTFTATLTFPNGPTLSVTIPAFAPWPTKSSSLEIGTSQISQISSSLAIGTSEIPKTTSQLVVGTSEIPSTTSPSVTGTSETPTPTSPSMTSTSETPTKISQSVTSISETATPSSQLVIGTSDMAQTTSQLVIGTSDIPKPKPTPGPMDKTGVWRVAIHLWMENQQSKIDWELYDPNWNWAGAKKMTTPHQGTDSIEVYIESDKDRAFEHMMLFGVKAWFNNPTSPDNAQVEFEIQKDMPNCDKIKNLVHCKPKMVTENRLETTAFFVDSCYQYCSKDRPDDMLLKPADLNCDDLNDANWKQEGNSWKRDFNCYWKDF